MKAIAENIAKKKEEKKKFCGKLILPLIEQCLWNCVEISYVFLELYKIIENILQNFSDWFFNKSYVTNNQCDMFKWRKIWPWKVEGVGFIQTFRVSSVVHISHKHMFITIYDIKRITYH